MGTVAKQVCGALLLATLVAPTFGHAQDLKARSRVAFYGGADVSTINHPVNYRVGALYFLQLVGPLELASAFDVIVDGGGGGWQALANARVRPFHKSRLFSMWYAGAGVFFQSSDIRKGILAGFEIPINPVRPFGEVRFHGPIEHMDGRVEVITGVSLPLP